MEQAMNKHNLFISNSNKNVIFILKLFLFGLLILVYINHILPQYTGSYIASIIDKIGRSNTINEPKIVLIGNSNLSFGIDSALMEQELKMPVVNMGLQGALGNSFHEEMARCNVNKGDIYIICHTDFSDTDSIGDTTLAWTAIENHYELWNLIRNKDIYPMVQSFPIYLKKSLNLYATETGNIDPGTVYSRSAFNVYGDIGLLREGTQYTFEKTVKPPEVNNVAINRINQLNKWMESKGATLLVAGYPIGKGDLTVDTQQFIDFQGQLKDMLECTVISDYTDYMFDYQYFYNTEFHLNSEGAVLRTSQLISDIKEWMAQKNEKVIIAK